MQVNIYCHLIAVKKKCLVPVANATSPTAFLPTAPLYLCHSKSNAENKGGGEINTNGFGRDSNRLMAAPNQNHTSMLAPQRSGPKGLSWACSRSLWQAGSWTLVSERPVCPNQGLAFLLPGWNSRNKESRSHSASTFPESLKSRDILGVTDNLGSQHQPLSINKSVQEGRWHILYAW